jgi:phosphate ABC transporter phosphate-binding protein
VRRSLIGLACLVCVLSGCSARPDRSLDGTGSTFVAPLFDKWSKEYKGAKLVYESIGSGIGFDRWKGGLFDFCCSDAPLTEKQLGEVKANRGEVVHIPLTIGAVVPVYKLNLKEGQTVVFNGPVLSDIYLGHIKKWNEQPLRDLNPGIELPDQDILVVHRQEPSGTTYIWTDYLSKFNAKEWKAATSPTWPVPGESAFGNAGVATAILAKEGSIGYVSLQEAEGRKLSIGKMTKTVDPKAETEIKSLTANAASAAAAVTSLTEIPDDLRLVSLTNVPSEDAWPICGTTWAIVSVNQPEAGRGQILKDFLIWATHEEGQKVAKELKFIPLPEALVKKVDKNIDKIKVGK